MNKYKNLNISTKTVNVKQRKLKCDFSIEYEEPLIVYYKFGLYTQLKLLIALIKNKITKLWQRRKTKQK